MTDPWDDAAATFDDEVITACANRVRAAWAGPLLPLMPPPPARVLEKSPTLATQGSTRRADC